MKPPVAMGIEGRAGSGPIFSPTFGVRRLVAAFQKGRDSRASTPSLCALLLVLVTGSFVSIGRGAESGPAAPEEKPAETAAAPVDLAPVVKQVGALETSIAEAREATAKESAATTAALAELKEDLAALRERLGPPRAASGAEAPQARRLDQIQDGIGELKRVLGASTAFQYPRLAAVLSGVAALLALIAIVAIFWIRPGSGGRSAVPGSVTRKLEDIHKAVGALGSGASDSSGGAKPAADVAATLVQATNALRAATEKNAREQNELSALVEQFQSVGSGLQPALDALGARLAEIEQSRVALADERAALERDKADLAAYAEASATEKQRAAGEASATAEKLQTVESRLAAYDALWPEAFHGNGPLAAAKDRVVAALSAGRAEAGDLYAALVRWHMVRSLAEKDRDQWIDAADAVGRASQAFLAKEPADDATAAEQLERAQLWTRSIKTPLEQAFPELKLNAVYAGDRFDTDRMEAISSISGGRQTVHRALSWSILEKTPESTRVVRRAQVITA